jgi:large subunit ribosomal protein L22
MDAGNMTPNQLAQTIAEQGFDAASAESAINNWLDSRDHPRCTAKIIGRIATALRATPKDIARFTSEIRHHRGSPRKARLLADLIRGKKVDVAVNLLTYTTKRAAVNIKKALNAAIADAELNDADVTRLVVVESRVNEGPRIKRFQPKDRGRAHPIIKPLSHITVGVEEK